MVLWVILTVMTAAAAVFLSAPLIRRFDAVRADGGGAVAVYRDQLREVDRERRDGLIDDAQAETAGIEIKRRILAADRAPSHDLPGLSGRERSVAVIAATAIVVLGSTILYAVTGSPDLAAVGSSPGVAPGSLRAAAVRGDRAPGLPPQHPAAGDPDAAGGDGGAGLPTVEEMTARLAARLARNPGDTDGWRTLGWSYLNIGRFEEAAAAYGKASEGDPGNPEFRAGRIEALLGAGGGVVTPAAKAAIRDALEHDPKDVRARYYAGLASMQDGDKTQALATWTALLSDAAGGHVDELLPDLRRRVSDLRRDMGLPGDVTAAAPAPPPAVPRLVRPEATAGPGLVARGGPDPQQVQAAEAMPPADRMAMIRSMVAGLSERLERSPRDADGWIRLMRSRMVLGEGDLAREALAHGLAAFPEAAAERERISAAAQELGVSP